MSTESSAEIPITRDLERAKNYIQSLDLSSVKDRLINIEGWSKKSAFKAVQVYRNYLCLRKKYPDLVLPPSYEIDEAWHAHILHTEDYVKFCDDVFGDYLHHYPHVANQGGDFGKLEKLFDTTQELHKKEFGDYLYHFKRRPPRIRNTLKKFYRTQNAR